MAKDSDVLRPAACQLLEAELDGNLNLYDAARNQVHILNATASDIWRLLDGHNSVDQLVEILADAYSVPPVQIRPHVTHTISTFSELGLLSDAGG